MKKALSISLLVICNAAAVFVLSVLFLLLFLLVSFNLPLTVLIGLAVLAALGFASSRILRFFKRRFDLQTPLFILFSHVPPVIGAAVYWIVFSALRAAGYFTGYFAGLSEFIFAIVLAPTAAGYFISGAVWCLSSKNPEKIRSKESCSDNEGT